MGYLTELLSLSEHVILVGDFNLPNINCEGSHTYQRKYLGLSLNDSKQYM